MKKNIKLKKLLTMYLTLTLMSSLTTFTSAKIKFTPKSTIKVNKKIPKKHISKDLKALFSDFNSNSLLTNKKQNIQLPTTSLHKSNKKNSENYNQRINLKFSSGDRLLNGVALWLINEEVMKEIYNKLNISGRNGEKELSFFDYELGFKDPEIHTILPYDQNETFDKTKNNLEKYLKTNFKNMCQSLANNLKFSDRLDFSYKLNYKVEKVLKEIEQQISSEITNINNEIKKINGTSTSSTKEYNITKGQQFFESEGFKSFVDFLNPNLYEFLKNKLNEVNNKKNIFSIIGKEISKKELENLKSKLNKMNSLKSNFSRLLPKEKNYSSYGLFNSKYNIYFDDDYDLFKYNKYNKYNKKYYYNNFYNNYYIDDDDDDDYFFKNSSYRSSKNKEKEEKRIFEITNKLKSILYNSVIFKDLKQENIETLNENKKEYEKYIKNLNLILENIKLKNKQKNNLENNSNNDIEYVVGELKNDYKQIKKMLKENKNKGDNNKNLKNEMEKILDSLNLSKTFNKNKKQNNKELIKKAKEWLPIKVKYIKNLLNNKKLKNIKGKFIENQNLEETNLNNSTTNISEQSTMDETNLSNLSTDMSNQTDVNEVSLNNNNLKKQKKLSNKSLDIKNLQAMKNLINNISKKTNKKTSKKSN